MNGIIHSLKGNLFHVSVRSPEPELEPIDAVAPSWCRCDAMRVSIDWDVSNSHTYLSLAVCIEIVDVLKIFTSQYAIIASPFFFCGGRGLDMRIYMRSLPRNLLLPSSIKYKENSPYFFTNLKKVKEKKFAHKSPFRSQFLGCYQPPIRPSTATPTHFNFHDTRILLKCSSLCCIAI